MCRAFSPDALAALPTNLRCASVDLLNPVGLRCNGCSRPAKPVVVRSHQHSGQPRCPQLAINRRTFNALKLDAILYIATGCGVHLLEYERSWGKN